MRSFATILAAALLALCLGPRSAFAQAPPGTGAYTFQGQGNLPQILSSLANPQVNQVPIGNGQNGYSLIVPFGDLTFTPGGPLGKFNITGSHYGVQTCSTSPCTITSTVVRCDATGGARVLKLPGAAATGVFYWISKVDSSNNTCTVTPAGADTINGVATSGISTQGQGILLDDALTGTWLGALILPVSSANTNSGNFPLQSTANANNWSIQNMAQIYGNPMPTPTPAACTATCTGTCATTYTYNLTAGNDVGSQTQPSNNITCTNAAALSTSNFNTISWTNNTGSRSTGVYGRISGSLGLLVVCYPGGGATANCLTPSSYKDDGSAAVGVAPPTYNHTGTLLSTGALTGSLSFHTVNINTNSLTGTVYLPLDGSTGAQSTEVLAQQITSASAVLRTMCCNTVATPGAGTFTYTLRKNGGSTAETCNYTGATTSCCDTNDAHAVPVSQLDLMNYLFVASAGSGQEGSCSVEIVK